MSTRKNIQSKPPAELTFSEKLAYRLDHPKFIATADELKAEHHRYDFRVKRKKTY